MRSSAFLSYGLLVLSAVATPAEATVVRVPPLEQMARESDVIAEVVVGEQRVVREGNRTITYTQVIVRDGVVGAKAGQTLEVFQVGGDWEGKTSWIIGAHRFLKGEELVLFGVWHPKGGLVVAPYGIGHGLFRVVPDVSGAKAVEIIGDVVAVDASGQAQGGAPAARTFSSVEGLKAAVRAALDGTPAAELPRKRKLAPTRRAR